MDKAEASRKLWEYCQDKEAFARLSAEELRHLLAQGADANMKLQHRSSVLEMAVAQPDTAKVQCLVPHARYQGDSSLLWRAVSQGSLEMVDALLGMEGVESHISYAFDKAFRARNFPIRDRLLEAMRQENIEPDFGHLMSWAVIEGNLTDMASLEKMGAGVNQSAILHELVMHRKNVTEFYEKFDWLTAHGASTSINWRENVGTIRNPVWQTTSLLRRAVWLAKKDGDIKLIKKILERHQKPLETICDIRETVQYAAIGNGYDEGRFREGGFVKEPLEPLYMLLGAGATPPSWLREEAEKKGYFDLVALIDAPAEKKQDLADRLVEEREIARQMAALEKKGQERADADRIFYRRKAEAGKAAKEIFGQPSSEQRVAGQTIEAALQTAERFPDGMVSVPRVQPVDRNSLAFRLGKVVGYARKVLFRHHPEAMQEEPTSEAPPAISNRKALPPATENFIPLSQSVMEEDRDERLTVTRLPAPHRWMDRQTRHERAAESAAARAGTVRG